MKTIFTDYYSLNQKKYSACLANNPEGNLSVNWGSKASQQKRFEHLYKITTDIDNAGILDVGCGIGHLLDFLKTKEFKGEYFGIDIVPAMIETAKKRHPKAKFSLQALDELKEESFDYVLMSGIFTYADEVIYQKLIAIAFQICTKGIAFNTLSSWAKKKEQDEFYADPIKTLSFCSTITTKLDLIHSYLPHDFTIYMYKDRTL